MNKFYILSLPALIAAALILGACGSATVPVTVIATNAPAPATTRATTVATVMPTAIVPSATAVAATATTAATGAPTKAATSVPTQASLNCPSPTTCIIISPTTGNVKAASVQVAIGGHGFPAGKVSILVTRKVGNTPLPGGPIQAGEVNVASDGIINGTFTIPSDEPELANARDLQVLAISADGTKGATVEFTNTGGVDLSDVIINDYTNPVFGFHFMIPAGFRARQLSDSLNEIGLYNPADQTRSGQEPITVRALPTVKDINGKPTSQMTLEEYARVALPNEVTANKIELISFQQLLPQSGLKAYQAVWRTTQVGGSTDTVITYYDLNKTINGQYYRSVQVVYNPKSKYGGEHSAVVNSLTLVQVNGQSAEGDAARKVVDQFMAATIQGNTPQALTYLAPNLRTRVTNNNPSLPQLLGVSNVSARFAITDQATFKPAGSGLRAVVKGYMGFDPKLPLQFELTQSGPSGNWLIDEVTPLQ